MSFVNLNDDSLSLVVSFLSQCDALRLSLTSRRIHPLAKRQALSAIDIKTIAQLERICNYLLADVTSRLYFVRTLKVSKVAFGIWSGEAGDFSAAHLLADVLEQTSHLQTLWLDAVGALFAAEPRVASALCGLDQLSDLQLEHISTDTCKVLGRLACTPRRLALFHFGDDRQPCDATSILRAPALRRVRFLHLYGVHIAERTQQEHSLEDHLGDDAMQWRDTRELRVQYSYVSMATLVRAFPNTKKFFLCQRRHADDLGEALDDFDPFGPPANELPPTAWSQETYEHGLETSETACWKQLDRAYTGSYVDFMRWRVACKVRWLLLDGDRFEHAWKALSIVRRTSPVVLSMQISPQSPPEFWQHVVHIAPQIRYLDLVSSGTRLEMAYQWTVCCVASSRLLQS
ncbi:uncharacterized protein B0H18DRAFT_986283 [Fomitopsis serialis]|uniref:uncharacterized protein n=1 Tax=Fomitopsis serialis TaxID=139415 RepID=UPI00200867AB|nr:uncharacterized protein B0H18DRAFT_986283 [Neoantrodia serialis]KAH9932568.1 hypothetical protein B0H18DRAFT_986283 [Neoantrodia serialis]